MAGSAFGGGLYAGAENGGGLESFFEGGDRAGVEAGKEVVGGEGVMVSEGRWVGRRASSRPGWGQGLGE